jgi:hypothetical protein
MAILSAIAFTLVLMFAGQSAQADWGVSFYGEVGGPRYSYYGDRLTSDYRRGYQIDDWIERGASSVTESPIFTDGVRLASWATRYEDDHDFGMASAIYFFEIPPNSRSMRIKIYYEGEIDRGNFNSGITGRVWIRRAYADDDYAEYNPDEGQFEDAEEPLYGDTFVLRPNKHLEILRMSAEDHVIDGMMELHVIAEGQQRVDVKYIEVETYAYLPSVRVVNRYYKDYTWRPWYDYTYSYFYTGPVFHFNDHFYVRYTYPRYRSNYVSIRRRYSSYLHGYYVKHPNRRVRWVNVDRVSRGKRRTWDRNQLNQWSREHDEARRSYVVTSTKKRRSADVRKSRTRVRSVLARHTRVSPATTRAKSGITGVAPSARRRATVQTRGSTSTRVKTRRESAEPQRREQYRSSSSSRRRTETSRDTKEPSKRVETPTRTRTTRSSSSNRRQQEREIKETPKRSTRVIPKKTEVKRKSTRTRTETRKSEPKPKPKPKQAPSGSSSTKEDDDDDDDKKKKSTRSKSSSSKSSSTTKKRKRTR